MNSSSLNLSDLQMDVMRVLWAEGEATVAKVHLALLDQRELAPTTVATLLSRLEKRELVTHRTMKRQYVYRASVSEEDVRVSMLGDLTHRVFQGDVASLVSHLLRREDMSPGDLARVRAMIEAREKEQGDDP